MRIKVIDAFGMHVGDAEVTWLPMATGLDQPPPPDELAKLIFDPEITVLLPTKNAQMPYHLEITP